MIGSESLFVLCEDNNAESQVKVHWLMPLYHPLRQEQWSPSEAYDGVPTWEGCQTVSWTAISGKTAIKCGSPRLLKPSAGIDRQTG